MPFRRNVRRRRRRPMRGRRRFAARRKGVVSRSLRPKIYNFKRSFVKELVLGVTGNDWTDLAGGTTNGPNAMVNQFQVTLGDIVSTSDFTNLFSMYKINAVAVKFYFGDTVSSATGSSAEGSRQLMMYILPWRTGDSEVLTENFCLATQKKQTRLCLNSIGKPVSVYMKMKQLNRVFVSDATYTTTTQAPKWISSAVTDVPHYGLNFRIQRCDGQDFTESGSTYQRCRIEHTVYFSCKQVE